MSDSDSFLEPNGDATKLAALRIAIERLSRFERRKRETKREAKQSPAEAKGRFLRLIEAELEH